MIKERKQWLGGLAVSLPVSGTFMLKAIRQVISIGEKMKREKDRDRVLRRLLEIYEICSRRQWPFWFRWNEVTGGTEAPVTEKEN